MSDEQPVFMFDADDPEMVEAYLGAQGTFRYFWRELAWEQRRIVPALEFACVKAPFSDDVDTEGDETPNVEHMWVSEIVFDGLVIRGVVINQPNWIQSVAQGDAVELPITYISDWMYSRVGEVHGGFTVQLMRRRMDDDDRAAHDEAWGLDFGDPAHVRIDDAPEHPMSENMAAAWAEQLTASPETATQVGENGWTMLHHLALAGSLANVELLLQHGADPHAKTPDGRTALDLAESLEWDRVAGALRAAMA